MDNKQQDPALQTPSEANRDKHMNYLAAEDDDNDSTGNSESNDEEMRNKRDADSGNDTTNAMLQQEELIDPGNEHTDRSVGSDEPGGRSPRHDADSGGDATGTMGSKPE